MGETTNEVILLDCRWCGHQGVHGVEIEFRDDLADWQCVDAKACNEREAVVAEENVQEGETDG